MDSKNKKLLIVFFVLIIALAALLFLGDGSKTKEQAAEEQEAASRTDQSQDYMTEEELRDAEEDLAHKSGWCCSSKENGKNKYEEFWLFSEHTNDYTYISHVENDVVREVSGHYLIEGDDLVYWIDGKEVEGKFEGKNLIIDGKVFEPLERE